MQLNSHQQLYDTFAKSCIDQEHILMKKNNQK